jgi:hypothetical protein
MKPSEKPRTRLVRSLTGHRKRFFSGHFGLRTSPNSQSERYSDPFSDSFITEFSEVAQEFIANSSPCINVAQLASLKGSST